MTTRILARGGWVTFAGTALLVAGVMNILAGIVALSQEQLYSAEELIYGDLVLLGTTLLLLGAIQAGTGWLVLARRAFGQFLGIMVAGLNGFWHFLFIGATPARSIAIMIVDGLIIYALTVHGDSFEV